MVVLPAAAIVERRVDVRHEGAAVDELQRHDPGGEAVVIQSGAVLVVRIGDAVDTFGGASGEEKARTYEVYGYAFLAVKPD